MLAFVGKELRLRKQMTCLWPQNKSDRSVLVLTQAVLNPPPPPACLTAELDQTGHFLCLSVLGYKTGMTASTLFGSGTDELSDVPDVLNTVKSKAGV